MTARGQREALSTDVRMWWATPRDVSWIVVLLKRYRDQEFFFVPDAAIPREVANGNILCVDYRSLEAGYMWGTFNRNGKSRINQVAISEELWRQGVGSVAVGGWEEKAIARAQWAVYLSCNSLTPGHRFWPTLGYQPVLSKAAGRRGGVNLIWAKVLDTSSFLLSPPSLAEVVGSYRLQSSIERSKQQKRALLRNQGKLFK